MMNTWFSRELQLWRRPSGIPTVADAALVEVSVDGPASGQVVRNRALSVESHMRGLMTEESDYTAPSGLNEPMSGRGFAGGRPRGIDVYVGRVDGEHVEAAIRRIRDRLQIALPGAESARAARAPGAAKPAARHLARAARGGLMLQGTDLGRMVVLLDGGSAVRAPFSATPRVPARRRDSWSGSAQ